MSSSALSRCLHSIEPAPAADIVLADCDAAWRAPGCLVTEIPAWTASYDTISRCFRCCVLAETMHPQLEVNYGFWNTTLRSSAFSVASKIHGQLPPTSVLIGHSSDLLLSDLGSPSDRVSGKRAFRELTRPPQTAAFRGASLVAIHGNSDALNTGFLPHGLLHAAELRLRPPLVLMDQGDTPEPPPWAVKRGLLDQPSLAAYFAHNPSLVHPKLRAYPCGIHNVNRWHALLSGIHNESGTVRGELATRRERPKLLFAGCMSSRRGRREKLAILRRNGFHAGNAWVGANLTAPAKCTIRAYMEAMLTSKFVLSPFGNGHNNHREWEALVAGAIVLVDADPLLEVLHEGLPVMHVRNWSLVTPAYLEAQWARFQQRKVSLTKAYMPYWLSQLLHPPVGRRGSEAAAAAADGPPFVPFPHAMSLNLVQTRANGQDAFDLDTFRRNRDCQAAGNATLTDFRLIAMCWPSYWDSRRAHPSAYPERYLHGYARQAPTETKAKLVANEASLRSLTVAQDARNATAPPPAPLHSGRLPWFQRVVSRLRAGR